MRKNLASSLTAALAVAVIVIAGAPPAAMAAPPAKADCGSFTDAFERVKCRHDAVADQMGYTADTAFGHNTVMRGQAGLGRIKHIDNSQARGQRGKRQNSMGVFKKLAKAEVRGNRRAGHLVPLDDIADDAEGDGICDFEQNNQNALCAAVELDDFGELQACNPNKKNKGKGKPGSDKFSGLECDLSFDPDNAADPTEAADMEQAAQEMEDTFGAVEDDLIEMNGHLDAINADTHAGSALLRSAAAGSCDIPSFGGAANAAAISLRALAVGGRWAASVAGKAGGQTFVVLGAGGNVLGTIAFLDIAAGLVEMSYIVADEIAINQRSQVQAATNDCVAEVVEEVGNLAEQVSALSGLMVAQHVTTRDNANANAAAIKANDNANTAALQARLDAAEAALSQLLNTPQGQRDSFPSQ